MKLRLITIVDVDNDAYAHEYGLSAAEVVTDAAGHVPAMLDESMTARAQQMGYFQIRSTTAQVLARTKEN